MKKLIALAVLSVAGLMVTVGHASAWWCCHKCANTCCTTICIHPYNAFTPICCGNLACNGCCPINLTQGCCQQGCGYPQCGPCYGAAPYGYGPSCYGAGCGDSSAYGLGQLPILDATQQRTPAMSPAPAAAPQTASPTYQGPVPAPKAGPTSYVPTLQSSQLPMISGAIQTVDYHQPAGMVMAPSANAFGK